MVRNLEINDMGMEIELVVNNDKATGIIIDTDSTVKGSMYLKNI